jgi:hypothetical protein
MRAFEETGLDNCMSTEEQSAAGENLAGSFLGRVELPYNVT